MPVPAKCNHCSIGVSKNIQSLQDDDNIPPQTYPIESNRIPPHLFSQIADFREPCPDKQTMFTQMIRYLKKIAEWHHKNFQRSNIEDFKISLIILAWTYIPLLTLSLKGEIR